MLGLRPGLIDSFSIFRYDNAPLSKTNGYKFIPSLSNKNSNNGKVEWLLTDNGTDKIFNFYRNKLRILLSRESMTFNFSTQAKLVVEQKL